VVLALFLLAVTLAGCSSGGSSTQTPPPPNPSSVTLTVTPSSANIRAGATFTFTATVTGSSNSDVTWAVNSSAGGSSTLGTIDSTGKYTAPATLPSPNTVTVSATSAADPTKSDSSAVTLLNPTPALTGISPASTNLGSFTLTVTGSQFVSGSQVLLGGNALTTTFVSSTQLSASGNASSAGTFAVSVRNPDPGSSTSSSVNFQVNGSVQSSSCSQMSVGQGASLNGFVPFPSDDLWNKDISAAAVDANSSAIINYIGASVGLHPDFGAGLYNGSSMGIPYTVVDGTQALIPVNYTAYGDESDPGPMPVPANAPIEGDPNPGNGDRHVLVIDNANCWLYELYSSYPNADGSWNAGSAAVWDLLNDEQRPWTWTSADAAGLSIFAGLARYDEAASGQIRHALRFTLAQSQAAFVPPASHWAANSTNSLAAPMGMRLRLKASYDISGFSATNQVILTTLKKYGMIMADNGSSMYISGAPDSRWNNDDLHNLGQVTASDFDVVQMNPIYTASNVPQGAAPVISSFTASSSMVSPGTPVTLSWSSTGTYFLISPIGPVRGNQVTVSPTQTTTYTLYATNPYGRTTATVTVTVN
jgi:hypothetical protein